MSYKNARRSGTNDNDNDDANAKTNNRVVLASLVVSELLDWILVFSEQAKGAEEDLH